MSRTGSVELVWAGDSRTFRLGIEEIFALQDKLDLGPAEIATRLRAGTWRLQYVQETFRISLIGGGMDAKKAKEMVDEHIVPGKITGHVLMAWAIIISALQGDESDPVGKEEGDPETTPASGSPPQPSMETALS